MTSTVCGEPDTDKLEIAVKLTAPAVTVAPDCTVTVSMTRSAVPPGDPAPGDAAAMVAEKVTPWPNTDGLWFDATVTVVSSLLTAWPLVRVLLLPLKLPSPL